MRRQMKGGKESFISSAMLGSGFGEAFVVVEAVLGKMKDRVSGPGAVRLPNPGADHSSRR